MEKTNINRLLRVFIPFIIMVMTQNLLLLLWDRIRFYHSLAETIAFTVASAAAIVVFLIGHTDISKSLAYSRRDAASDSMHFFFCVAMLIIFMHLTDLVTANYSTQIAPITPVYLISVLIIHPLAEEYIFRRLFYGELRKINPVFGIIAQAIMFAIIHSSVDGMIYALAAGVFLGIAVEKTGRLWVPVLAHIFINGRSLMYMAVLNNNDTLRKNIDITVIALGAVAFIVLLLMRRVKGAKRRFSTDERVETEWTETEL